MCDENFNFNEAVNYLSEYTGVKLLNSSFSNKNKQNQTNLLAIKILSSCNDFMI